MDSVLVWRHVEEVVWCKICDHVDGKVETNVLRQVSRPVMHQVQHQVQHQVRDQVWDQVLKVRHTAIDGMADG